MQMMMAQQLSIIDCRELAVVNNKSMIAARYENEKTRFDKAAYHSGYFPKISLDGGYLITNRKLNFTIPGGYLPTYVPSADGSLVPNLLLNASGEPLIGSDGSPLFNQYAYMPDSKLGINFNNTYMGMISVRQPLYTGGKIRSANKMAALGETISSHNLRKTHDDIIASSDAAFWELVKVLELHQVAQAYQEALVEAVKNVQHSADAGMIISSTILQAQSKLNEAKLMVLKAQNGIRLAQMNLCHITGLPLFSIIDPVTDIDPLLNKPVYAGHDIEQRAEIAMLNEQVMIMEEKIKLARSEFLPQIGLMGGYNYMGGITVGGNAMDNKGGFSASVTVSVPLVTWGETRNKIRAAKMEKQIVEIKKTEAEELMQLEIAKAFNDWEEAFLRVELTRSSIEVAQENSRIRKDNFELGFCTLTDYLEAEAMLQEAKSDYVEAKSAYWLSEIAYRKGIGRLE